MTIIFDTFLAWAAISTLAPLLTAVFGKPGAMVMLFIDTIVVELFVVSLVIGVFGGRWIGKPSVTGFILSGVYYIGWHFRSVISVHRPTFDFLTFFIFLGFPVVVIVGGLIYTRVCKSYINRDTLAEKNSL